jgi:hypothetical protein
MRQVDRQGRRGEGADGSGRPARKANRPSPQQDRDGCNNEQLAHRVAEEPVHEEH